MIFGKKEKGIEELISKLVAKVKQTLPEMSKMIHDYIKSDKQFKEDSYRIHIYENEADAIRHEILLHLSKGAFLPFYREDYIVITYLADGIADLAESLAEFLVLTRPKIPDFIQEGLKELLEATNETMVPLERMFEVYWKDLDQIPALAHAVELQETEVDKIQWQVIKAVFKSDLPLAEKLHLKEFINRMAGISDQIEDTANRFEIMLAKRPG